MIIIVADNPGTPKRILLLCYIITQYPCQTTRCNDVRSVLLVWGRVPELFRPTVVGHIHVDEGSFDTPCKTGPHCQGVLQRSLWAIIHNSNIILFIFAALPECAPVQSVVGHKLHKIKMAQHLDSRCVLVPAPWVLRPKHFSNSA